MSNVYIENAPPWFKAAMKEIGTKEERDNRGPAIARYIKMGKCGSLGSPWCAVFSNAMLESTSIPGTRSALARSYENSAKFEKLSQPIFGCIVTFWRGTRKSGLGHVGFYNGEVGDYISVLGGNEGDMVQVESYRRNSKSFGLSGYYWPKGIPKPTAYPAGPVRNVLASGVGGGKVT